MRSFLMSLVLACAWAGVARAQDLAARPETEGREIVHWIGDLAVEGQARIHGDVSMRNNRLRVQTGETVPLRDTQRFRLWQGDDDVFRLTTNETCVAAIFPNDYRAVHANGGGEFTMDFAYTNAPSRCTQHTNETTHLYLYRDQNDMVRIRYEATYDTERPRRATVSGVAEGVLRPVYRPAPRRAQPNDESQSAAAFGGAALMLLLLGAMSSGPAASSNEQCEPVETTMRDALGSVIVLPGC